MSVPAYRVEPLRVSHDRAAFSCGVAELDYYLHHQAGQDARRKVAAPFVMLDKDDVVVGYYTLSSYSVRGRELPDAIARRLPRYPLLPATLLGRLAVNQEHRGRKIGQLLLMDALHRSWKNTAEVASVGVVVEAFDGAARAFYQHHQFMPLADHPNKLFITMATLEKAFKVR
ncbi:MAG: GNAT family N-acetyltransferase [Acidobacteriia bacterium]|nr:GNAT family N-acetyltransferase [Terriglobia bacterium]